jgi:hypothetical protein
MISGQNQRAGRSYSQIVRSVGYNIRHAEFSCYANAGRLIFRRPVILGQAPSTTGSQKEHSDVELFCGITPLRARSTRETLRGIYRGPGERRGA